MPCPLPYQSAPLKGESSSPGMVVLALPLMGLKLDLTSNLVLQWGEAKAQLDSPRLWKID